MTVLGSAGDATVSGAVAAGVKHGKKVATDLIGVVDRIDRARELWKLGVALVELHAGLDEQAQPGYSLQMLLDDGKIAGVAFSIAGGHDRDGFCRARRRG